MFPPGSSSCSFGLRHNSLSGAMSPLIYTKSTFLLRIPWQCYLCRIRHWRRSRLLSQRVGRRRCGSHVKKGTTFDRAQKSPFLLGACASCRGVFVALSHLCASACTCPPLVDRWFKFFGIFAVRNRRARSISSRTCVSPTKAGIAFENTSRYCRARSTLSRG